MRVKGGDGIRKDLLPEKRVANDLAFKSLDSTMDTYMVRIDQRRVSPSAQRTNEHPARIVSAAPTASREGLTSTYRVSVLPGYWFLE